MPPSPSHAFTCFDGNRRVVTGSLQAVALSLKGLRLREATGPVLVFDNATGRTIDIDTRGSDDEVLAHLAPPVGPGAAHPSANTESAAPGAPIEPAAIEARGRGRPKLGVVPREVTLLPRHWEWLGAQPGGASVALRKLVEEARRASAEKDAMRQRHERAYHFMTAIAGDLPGFEEATRALFADDPTRFRELLSAWPADIRDHALGLGFEVDPHALRSDHGDPS